MTTTHPELLNAAVVFRQDINPELCIVRISPDSGSVPDFEPGQFITIGLPKDDLPPGTPGSSPKNISVSGNDPGTASTLPPPPTQGPPRQRAALVRRAYSIASSPNQKDSVELYLVLVKDGRLTPYLWTLQPGERIWMDHQAKGEFTLRNVPPDKDLVLVSTGTGLAPYMSMLRTYRGQSRWRRCVVIHGVRIAQDLGYRQELETLAAQDPTVIYLPTVTREPQDSPWRGQRGRIQALLEPETYRELVGAPLDPQQCHVFLCGNPEMIKATEELLTPRGFTVASKTQPGTIHYERYW